MLELKQISYAINESGSKHQILDHISLDIPAGSLTVITGPNGSGKSTLAQLIMGIKRPTSGRIFLKSEDITDKDITNRAQLGISFSFQRPVVFKGITVYELLSTAHGELLPPSRAANFLKQVGLAPDDYLKRDVSSKLSGGELKRIEIATVLARQADFAIFDEPEAGIDLWSFKNLTHVFQKIHQQSPDKSILIISHQERILEIADQIIVLKDGQISATGTPSEIMSIIAGGNYGT